MRVVGVLWHVVHVLQERCRYQLAVNSHIFNY